MPIRDSETGVTFAPDEIGWIDFETRNVIHDIKPGTYRYATTADGVILAFAIGDGPERVIAVDDFPQTLHWDDLPDDFKQHHARVERGEAVWAAWNAAFDKAIWKVPLVDLKDREHRKEPFEIPLAPRAVEIVREMEKARVSTYVFPGQRKGQPLSNMAFLTLLKRMNATRKGEQPDPNAKPRWHDPTSGKPVTAHGFRATLKTWAEEAATFPHAVVEMALGHQVGNAVERAYRRTDLLEQRRQLMNAWAKFCEPARRGDVIELGSRRA